MEIAKNTGKSDATINDPVNVDSPEDLVSTTANYDHYVKQLAILGNTKGIHQRIHDNILVGDVLLAWVHFRIAFHQIRIYNKLDLVRPYILWMGQSQTKIRR